MESYIGKSCRLHIVLNNKDLYYTAKIIDVSQTHITFVDKFNEKYTFRMIDVVEIKG